MAQKTNTTARRILVLLGPPGAGKGTQADRLCASLGLPHISTGDLFREHLKRESELGRRAKSFMDRGALVPDQVVLEMLFDRVAAPDCQGGYLLDGFPRTLAQAEALERRLASEGKTDFRVLDLEVPDEVLIERLTGRRTCRACGNVHHLRFFAPRVSGRCDKCGGELYQRTDDTREVVANRLEVYRRETQPLTAFYDARGVLCRLDGNRPADEVFEQLLRRAAGGEAA